jgi:hypothetical protein
MKLKRALALLLAAAALFVLLPGTAQAAKDISVVGLLFGDQMFPDAWNRLEVRVQNNSNKDFQGSVLVELGGEYVRDVFVEAGKTGSLVFYLPPLGYIQRDYANVTIHKIYLRDQRGRIVNQATLANRPATASSSSIFVGVMGKQAGDFKRIGNVLGYLSVAGMSPESLDNLQFAENYRTIILSNPGSVTLSPQQAANLRRWLESGGMLVVGGGSGWQQSAALLPPDMLPVRIQGVDTIAAGDLAALDLSVLEESEYTIAVGEVVGQVLVSAGDKPLLAAKTVGNGTVLWSALDLEAAPLLNPANSEAFWQKIFLLRPVVKVYSVDNNFYSQLFNSISQDSLASALSPGKLFLLLLGYIILVGPVNWLVLRKIDRREWAWFVIPAVALLLTAGAFVYGRLGRGSDKVLYQVNLIELYSQNQAKVQSLNGVFVPSSRGITLSSEAYLAPLSGEMVSRLEGGQQELAMKNPPLWSVQKFYGAGVLDLPGSVQIEANYNSAQNRLEARVTNYSGQDFFASFIQMGKEWFEFGPLAAGESKMSTAISQPDFQSILSRYNSSGRAFPGWYDFSYYFPNTSVYFLGFGDSGPLPVAGVNKKIALDIWVKTMETSDFYAAGSLNIPRGILTPVVLGSARTDYYSPRDYHFYSNEEANVDLVFSLPENVDFSQGEYRLNLDAVWGEAKGTVLVYNYKSNLWQELGTLDNLYKHSRYILLENPGDLVYENHLTVRIKYTGDLGFNLDGMDISVTGGRIND